MSRLILGLIFVGLAIFVFNYGSTFEDEQNDTSARLIRSAHEEDVLENKIKTQVNRAVSIDELDKAEENLNLLKNNKNMMRPIIGLKRAGLYFNEAEEYLRKAVEIEKAVEVASPPLSPEEASKQKAFHPLTVINLEKAYGLYDKARKEAERLKDDNDSDINYNSNYLKGEIYYRILELMADQESAMEIFNQTVTYYKYALRNRPNDINTIVNIEILIKNQNGLVGNASNPQARRKQMLNSKKYGVSKSSGN